MALVRGAFPFVLTLIAATAGCDDGGPHEGNTALCDDGVRNGDESGVDCGGSCTACAPDTSCSDGVENGLETDVDCGGAVCLPCGQGEHCLTNTDCLTSLCESDNGSPTSGTCTDNILGRDNCDTDDECGAGFCEEGWCKPPQASALAAGDRHACALVQKGQVRCWGDTSYGQTGRRIDGSPLSMVWVDLAEGGVPRPLEGMTSLVAGPRNTCAFNSQSVYCWGETVYAGPEGVTHDGAEAFEIFMYDETVTPEGDVVRDWPAMAGVQAMALGEKHSCVLMGDGVRCWGDNNLGQLAEESRGRWQPGVDAIMPLGFTAYSLTAGTNHTCVSGDSGVVCWGDNITGQASATSEDPYLIPTNAFDRRPVKVEARGQTSCAEVVGQTMPGTQIGTGQAWCWGVLPFEPAEGVGPGPVRLQGVPGFALMAVGERFMCVLTALGVECLGEMETAMNLLPAQLRTVAGAGGRLDSNDPVRAIVASRDFACSLAQEGEVRCWGDNAVGQLADENEAFQGRATAKPWTP